MNFNTIQLYFQTLVAGSNFVNIAPYNGSLDKITTLFCILDRVTLSSLAKTNEEEKYKKIKIHS